MDVVLIFVWIYAAMVAMAFWESYSEQRSAWDKGKAGWKIILGKYRFTGYHFWLLWIMLPLLISLPLAIYGWDSKLAGILLSAYLTGSILEDFMWYVVNPKVKLKEFYSKFSDYYPWIRIGGKKIIPWGYAAGIVISVLSWIFLWS